jgi:hypothetical protein
MLFVADLESLQRTLHAVIAFASRGERPAGEIHMLLRAMDPGTFRVIATQERYGMAWAFVESELQARAGCFVNDWHVALVGPGRFVISAAMLGGLAMVRRVDVGEADGARPS